jgi:8-oxo-dGTP pyrophosphatase MutT (NUDIX family)
MTTRSDISAVLAASPLVGHDEWRWLTGADPALEQRVRAAMPVPAVEAAVLVPLVEHADGLAVLLTERAAGLNHHAGQISFPGGRIEAGDRDPYAAALREASEEIGLQPELVSFGGYLPQHPILTGYRVTPAVGFLAPGYALRLDAGEVHDAFEVPLRYLFDPANHRPRRRVLGSVTLETVEIPYRGRTIWGATCGMLLTLRGLLHGRQAQTA